MLMFCACLRPAVKEPSMSAKRLATEALTRGSADNITVIVAFLQAISQTLCSTPAQDREL